MPASILLTALLATSAPAVLPARQGEPAPAETSGQSTSIEELRGRIHDLRMDLVLGGDSVRRAEAEALEFYGEKIGLLEQRLDSLEAELSEKRATYEVTLEEALAAEEPAGRRAITERGLRLRAEIASLEQEKAEVARRRRELTELRGAVEARGREREALAARLETAGSVAGAFAMPLGSVGLAPAESLTAPPSPFDDEDFLRDLQERDRRRARRLLFEADPERYWERFPLTPPREALAEVLAFPVPDVPGQR